MLTNLWGNRENQPLDVFDKCQKFVRAKELMANGHYPYFRAIEETEANEVIIANRRMIMIGSNNYLGLTHHPEVQEAAVRAIHKYGSGCTGSRFLNGTLDLHEELEDRLAKFMGFEAALTFTTGFQTNLGSIATLVGKNDVILCDRENHASIIDGCRLSFGETKKYRHNDLEDLERILQSIPPQKGKLIITDGVFSMLGDVVNLPEIVKLAKKYEARVTVDDAHGIGVLGAGGRGTCEHFGLTDEVDVLLGTFSKSFASVGGFVAGSKNVIHYIKHHARPLIFSASLPPASAAVVIACLDIIEREPERKQALWRNVNKMKTSLDAMGFDTGPTESPIIPIVIGDMMTTFKVWKYLFERGIYTNPVISPAVPAGKDLIRTSYMATHTDEELDRVLEVFEGVRDILGAVTK